MQETDGFPRVLDCITPRSLSIKDAADQEE